MSVSQMGEYDLGLSFLVSLVTLQDTLFGAIKSDAFILSLGQVWIHKEIPFEIPEW